MRKKIQIGFIIGTVVLLLVMVLWIRDVRSRVHDLPSIMKSGRLSVLLDSSETGFSVKGDSVFGFQYEIVKAFADSLGLELVITEQSDLKSCMEDIESGDYDIIASFVPVTTEWKNKVLFTIPFFNSRQVLVQRLSPDSLHKPLIKSHVDLANDTIYLPSHSPYRMRIRHLSDEIAEPIHVVEVKNVTAEQLVRFVARGKMKYTICDEQLAKKLQTIYPDIDISLQIGFEQQQAWVVHSKSPLLLERLNSFLSDYVGSTAYWELYQKYY